MKIIYLSKNFTMNLIEKIKSQSAVNHLNSGTQSKYDYSKIAKNSTNLFSNSNIPALISKSKNINTDEDLKKKIRTNLRKILKVITLILINDKEKKDTKNFLQNFELLKEYYKSVFSDTAIFSPDTLINNESKKEVLSDLFTYYASINKSEKKPTEKKPTEKKPAKETKQDKKMNKEYQNKAIKDIKEGKVDEE